MAWSHMSWMTWGEWVATIIWRLLTLQMSRKYLPSICCQETCRDSSGSSMMTRDPGSAWNSRA